MEVPFIVDLFDDINFGGSQRTLVRDLADFRQIEFNDRTSSVIVTAGPNFQTGDFVRLWSDINFQGVPLEFPVGQFPDLRAFNFNDVASSMQIVTGGGGGNVVAEDRQTESIPVQLQVTVPSGTTLVSVQRNDLLNPTATGSFVGATGVRVIITLTDRLTVTIRDASGATRTAAGQTTLQFRKDINFPQLAGLDKSNLVITASLANLTSSFTLSGNTVNKTIRFDLTTRVIRTQALASVAELPVKNTLEYEINVE